MLRLLFSIVVFVNEFVERPNGSKPPVCVRNCVFAPAAPNNDGCFFKIIVVMH